MNKREDRAEADKEMKVVERIQENQQLLGDFLTDMVALKHNQFSFQNHISLNRRNENFTTILDPSTEEFVTINIKKVRKEIADLEQKIQDDIAEILL